MFKAAILSLLSLSSALGFDWEAKEIEGVKCVPLGQVAEFYKLPTVDAEALKIMMKNRDVTMTFEAGSKLAILNEVHFELIHSLQASDGRTWISTRDLKEWVDPVLRPHKVQGQVKFQTVFLDPRIDFEQAALVATLNEVKKEIEGLGFKAEILWKNDEAISDQEKLEKIAASGDAVYLELKMAPGETTSLRTSAFGRATKSRGQSVEVATALHWSILRGSEKADLEMVDRWITCSEEPSLAGLNVPACLLDLTFQKGAEEPFRRHLAKAVSNGLRFARKALDQRPAGEPE